MSKLSHSHQPTMNRLDLIRAIADGDEDLVLPINCARCGQEIDDISAADGCEDRDCWIQEIERDADLLRRVRLTDECP